MGHISDVPKQLGASLKHTTEGDFTKLGVEVTGCFNLQDSVNVQSVHAWGLQKHQEVNLLSKEQDYM